MPSLPRIRKSKFLPLLSTLVLLLSVITGVVLVQEQQELREKAQSFIPAFPGAEGFGARSIGGRGGKVFEVTNLNNSGSGSLRACIEASGPRTCVFRTGGTIELSSPLIINNPYITIAGQTAPGGGITLRNGSNRSTPLTVRTHDVVIRFLRSRPGAGGEPDGIYFGGSSYNVIIDHCSVSWAVDENLTASAGSHDISIQWCLISEGLDDSTHSKGPHSKGLMLGSSSSDTSKRISIHHNLLVHNVERNPRIQIDGIVDFVNNVVHNWRGSLGVFTNNSQVNYVGNYIKKGPNSDNDYAVNIGSSSVSVYVAGNISHHRTSNSDPEENVVNPGDRGHITSRFSAPEVTTYSCHSINNCEAYDQVLAQAGATLPIRDSVDQRIVNDVKNGIGRIINDPSEVGGWPRLASGTPPADSDHDGMADNWEVSNFGNLSRNGTGDANNNGYTDLEEYLNQLAGAVPPPPPPGTPTPTKPPTPTPTPTGPPPPPPSGFTLLTEAEEMTLVSPMTLGTADANALVTKYISPTSGSNSTSPKAEATLNFTLPSTGIYYLWARIMGPDGGSDALYLGIDGSFDRVFPSGVGFYDWVKVETANGSGSHAFSLSGGTHTYQVGHGEINARLDALYITDDPNDIPTFSPGAPPPPSPTPTPLPPPLPGDLDADGDVDIFDYNALVSNFGATNCGNQADIDGDCDVDIFDYNILVGNFGKKG